MSGAKQESSPPDRSSWISAQGIERLEWLLIAFLTCVYIASFTFASDVNGMGQIEEVFDQDSRYVIRSLGLDIPYEWNGQNHMLYHWLTDRGFRLWKLAVGGGIASAFYFLKIFTALTGCCFLIALRSLCVEAGLGARDRLAFLPFAGLSLAIWFHFSAFETWGLGMPALVLFLLALLRRLRRNDVSVANHALLIGSLLFAFWTRSDQWRLPVATALILLLPGVRPVRRSLLLDLFLFGVLAPVGLTLLTSDYYQIPLGQGLRKLSERHDFEGLKPLLGTLDNLRPAHLWRVFRANGLYSILMPVTTDTVPFRGSMRGFFKSPLSLVALIAVGLLLVRTSLLGVRKLLQGDAYQVVLWSSWGMGWLFYTWFNPREPFLWVVQFGVLQFAAIVDTWQRGSTRFTWAVAGTGLLVALHNTVFFWLRYR
jgi:hypothetical protein